MTEGIGGTPGPPPGYQEPQAPGVAVGPPGRRTLAALGGASVFVQATAPAPPPPIPVNSIWLNTTLGALETWNGSTWVIQAFTGTELITAGTIAANLLVASIVVGGIVDGTTVKAASFIGGNYFGYSTPNPTLDALVVSLIPGTATVADSVGNTALPGTSVYGGSATKWFAVSLGGNGLALAWFQMTTADMNGAWTLAGEFVPSFGAPVAASNSGKGFVWGTSATPEPTGINGVLQMLGGLATPATILGIVQVFADASNNLRELTPGGLSAVLQLGQSDSTVTGPITPTVFTGVTKSWLISSADSNQAGRMFRLTAWGKASFSTTAASNGLTFAAGALGNTAVNLPIGSTEWLATSIQATAWRAVVEITVINSTTVDVGLHVTISLNSGNLLTTVGANASFSGFVFQNGEVTDLTIAQNILLFAKFSGSAGGPNITCYDSTLERVR